ncbi:growth-regulating factor 6-like [Chenopodium quinoa]|uniref:growth-regulating factor 6-like n=1 Tax=Chenopodium quinoa TaxID=63459 RepID=UPI000B784DA5|nr:growth-regulating factor 6-like [Chenopodium quinoa]
MSIATATAAGGGRTKFPFTATQWQELEHQALIYKYMAAGIPIPSDLLFTVKRSLDSSISSKLFPYQPSPLGWNPYQMGYGKKIDPEPGRCRRTDGKKWRCSKEAYPDSKYCERHMHRGKNRSRKPVESSPLTTANSNSSNNNHNHSHNNNNISISSNNNNNCSTTNSSLTVASAAASLTNQSLLSKNPCSVSSASLFSLPSPDSSCNSLYPPFKNSHKDYNRERYYQGLKEEVGEHAFFTDSSGSSMRGFSGSSMEETWQLGNLDHHSKQSGGYPNYLQQLNNGSAAAAAKQQQEKQCYIWGRDFNCDLSMKVEDERENFHEKTTHHFFDEWPIKGGGGRGGRENSWLDSSSTTQLSISIPNSSSHHHDFFLTNSRET